MRQKALSGTQDGAEKYYMACKTHYMPSAKTFPADKKHGKPGLQTIE